MKNLSKSVFLLLALGTTAVDVCAGDTTRNNTHSVPAGDAGLTLPQGFSATVFAADLGRARHIAVAPNGDVYVKLEKLSNGKGILRLRDTNGDGKVDQTIGFGNYVGTGIAIRNGYLYASSNSSVYRYRMNEKGEVLNTEQPETIVTGLVDRNQHNSKSITLDNAGNIYVNIGAPSNACQEKDRTNGSPGQDPCPILETAGGIWQFKADGKNQSYKEGTRYATGLRNVVGLDWNSRSNDLYVVQHGRDDLYRLYSNLYTEEQSSEQPAEEFFRVKKGADFGWPYCYYDWQKKQKILNPEYGGDAKTEGRCTSAEKPIVAFPGHWGPNGLLFYTGNLFPEKYRNGAFIAFHGSWNRSNGQKGYKVSFVPFDNNGAPSGEHETFADGFTGSESITSPGQAKYRPCGLAQGPDGALYISDDVNGTIWKISYPGY